MDSKQQQMPKVKEEPTEHPRVPSMCSICHNEPPINAVQLNCNHIFCYLCVKSVSETTGICPLCRSEIGIEFKFQEHHVLGLIRVPTSTNGYYWFYEGYRGWWLYDAETNGEIEGAYQRGGQRVEKLIAGFMYVIDLRSMAQQRKGTAGRSRRICRATLGLDGILGLAGLKGNDFNDMLNMMKSNDRMAMMRIPHESCKRENIDP